MTTVTPSPGEEQLGRLRAELAELIADARTRAEKCQFWALFWQTTDVALGLPTAILAAVAGVTGLVSTTGRVLAGILALTAGAMTAATHYLKSNERYKENLMRARAWQTLARDASFASAAEGYPGIESLYDTIRAMLVRHAAIMEIGRPPVPEKALGQPPTDVTRPSQR